MHLDAGLAHLLEEIIRHLPAAHIIVDYSHLYPLLGFRHQRIGHHVPQGIVVEDITVYMHVVSGLSDITQQRMEEIVAVREDVNRVVLEGQRPVLVQEKFDERRLFVRNLQVLLLGKFKHRAFCQLVERTL